jgi:hypothetical protein
LAAFAARTSHRLRSSVPLAGRAIRMVKKSNLGIDPDGSVICPHKSFGRNILHENIGDAGGSSIKANQGVWRKSEQERERRQQRTATGSLVMEEGNRTQVSQGATGKWNTRLGGPLRGTVSSHRGLIAPRKFKPLELARTFQRKTVPHAERAASWRSPLPVVGRQWFVADFKVSNEGGSRQIKGCNRRTQRQQRKESLSEILFEVKDEDFENKSGLDRVSPHRGLWRWRGGGVPRRIHASGWQGSGSGGKTEQQFGRGVENEPQRRGDAEEERNME